MKQGASESAAVPTDQAQQLVVEVEQLTQLEGGVIDVEQASATSQEPIVTEQKAAVIEAEQITQSSVDGVESEVGNIDVESIISETVKNSPEHSLEVVFTAECWVEVKDAEGNMLVADLKSQGDKLQIEGLAPFEILLGYAPAASLSYNGEPVKININTRSKSARFTVGKS